MQHAVSPKTTLPIPITNQNKKLLKSRSRSWVYETLGTFAVSVLVYILRSPPHLCTRLALVHDERLVKSALGGWKSSSLHETTYGRTFASVLLCSVRFRQRFPGAESVGN